MPTDPLQTALAHHQAGRLDQAEALYRQILAREPRQADVLHLLGLLAHQRGMHARAAELIERAIGIQPGQAVYHSNLAEVHRAMGDLGRAETDCRRALALAPEHPEALNNLALILRQSGRSDEAVAILESAIKSQPGWPAPYLQLGTLLRKQGKPREAAAVWRQGVRHSGDASLRGQLGPLLLELGDAAEALHHLVELDRQQPNDPAVLMNLGNALADLGRRDEARVVYSRVIALAPHMSQPYAHLGMLDHAEGRLGSALAYFDEAAQRKPADPGHGRYAALVLHEMERTDESIARLRVVIDAYPDHAPAHNSLGLMLRDQGAMPEARAAFLEAIRLKPDFADAYHNLALVSLEMGEKEEALAALREALRHVPAHPESLAALGMALRDSLPPEEEKACERALSRTDLAGRSRAILLHGLAHVMDARCQYDRAAALAREANECLRRDDQQRRREYNPAIHRAQVEQILQAFSSAHFERVRGWGHDSEQPVFVLGLPRSGTSLVEQILASHPKVYGAGELALMRDLFNSLPGLVGRNAPAGECLDALNPELVSRLAGRYLEQVRGPGLSGARIVDKTPDNYLWLGWIATLFPRARIIHTRRDVRDTGLSIWMTHFQSLRWACDLRFIGERIREYRRLMDHWRCVLPGRMLEVDYEDLVVNLEPAARRLLQWCGLEWDPACLAFHTTRRVVRTASMVQVRQPIYARSVQRWRHYQAHLGPLLEIVDEGDGEKVRATHAASLRAE